MSLLSAFKKVSSEIFRLAPRLLSDPISFSAVALSLPTIGVGVWGISSYFCSERSESIELLASVSLVLGAIGAFSGALYSVSDIGVFPDGNICFLPDRPNEIGFVKKENQKLLPPSVK